VVRPLKKPTPEQAKAYEIHDFDAEVMDNYLEASAGRK
jgi:hypothetical protein